MRGLRSVPTIWWPKKGEVWFWLGNRYPAWVHGLVLAMNNALGAFGSTLEVLSAPRIKTANLRRIGR